MISTARTSKSNIAGRTIKLTDSRRSWLADLVARNVDVIVANQGSAAAVMAANKTIPFVFVIGGDPIRLGLVPSLSRPGGNVTGLTFLQETVVANSLS